MIDDIARFLVINNLHQIIRGEIMLRFNFEKMLKARGIEKPFSYLVNAGFSKGLAQK